MSNALVPRSGGSGVVPAVCSALIPGVGQLINGESDKALGVFAVAALCSGAILGGLPLIGGVASLVGFATWIYGVGDAYVQGKKRR
jgi:TM2 domain-containing membrane protein YozV